MKTIKKITGWVILPMIMIILCLYWVILGYINMDKLGDELIRTGKALKHRK